MPTVSFSLTGSALPSSASYQQAFEALVQTRGLDSATLASWVQRQLSAPHSHGITLDIKKKPFLAIAVVTECLIAVAYILAAPILLAAAR